MQHYVSATAEITLVFIFFKRVRNSFYTKKSYFFSLFETDLTYRRHVLYSILLWYTPHFYLLVTAVHNDTKRPSLLGCYMWPSCGGLKHFLYIYIFFLSPNETTSFNPENM